MVDQCWYVAYGSNLVPHKLTRYVGDDAAVHDRPHRHLTISRELYFAGVSRRWAGGVAFVSLHRDDAHLTRVRAYRVSGAELASIFQGENGGRAHLPTGASLSDIPVDGHRRVPTERSADGTLGKYDTVLRFGDIEGLAAFTFSTSLSLPRRAPDREYYRTIVRGVSAVLRRDQAARYVDGAVARSSQVSADG